MSDSNEITVVVASCAHNSRPSTRDPAPGAPEGPLGRPRNARAALNVIISSFSRLNLASWTIGSFANRSAVSQIIVRTRLPAMRSIMAANPGRVSISPCSKPGNRVVVPQMLV
jgi:hypothetical protein